MNSDQTQQEGNQKTLRALFIEREEITKEIETLKSKVKLIDQSILESTRHRIESLYTLQGKQHGTVRAVGLDGTPIKGDISKKVEWDSAPLMSVAGALPWDTVSKLFDIKFSVPEKVYKKLAEFGLSDELVSAIDGARTVKYGDLKVTLEGD